MLCALTYMRTIVFVSTLQQRMCIICCQPSSLGSVRVEQCFAVWPVGLWHNICMALLHSTLACFRTSICMVCCVKRQKRAISNAGQAMSVAQCVSDGTPFLPEESTLAIVLASVSVLVCHACRQADQALHTHSDGGLLIPKNLYRRFPSHEHFNGL